MKQRVPIFLFSIIVSFLYIHEALSVEVVCVQRAQGSSTRNPDARRCRRQGLCSGSTSLAKFVCDLPATGTGFTNAQGELTAAARRLSPAPRLPPLADFDNRNATSRSLRINDYFNPHTNVAAAMSMGPRNVSTAPNRSVPQPNYQGGICRAANRQSRPEAPIDHVARCMLYEPSIPPGLLANPPHCEFDGPVRFNWGGEGHLSCAEGILEAADSIQNSFRELWRGGWPAIREMGERVRSSGGALLRTWWEHAWRSGPASAGSAIIAELRSAVQAAKRLVEQEAEHEAAYFCCVNDSGKVRMACRAAINAAQVALGVGSLPGIARGSATLSRGLARAALHVARNPRGVIHAARGVVAGVRTMANGQMASNVARMAQAETAVVTTAEASVVGGRAAATGNALRNMAALTERATNGLRNVASRLRIPALSNFAERAGEVAVVQRRLAEVGAQFARNTRWYQAGHWLRRIPGPVGRAVDQYMAYRHGLESMVIGVVGRAAGLNPDQAHAALRLARALQGSTSGLGAVLGNLQDADQQLQAIRTQIAQMAASPQTSETSTLLAGLRQQEGALLQTLNQSQQEFAQAQQELTELRRQVNL